MPDTTNPALFETLLPLLAAGTAAAFPRYGAPAVGLGLTTYDMLKRQQERARYSDMIQQKHNDEAAAGRNLQGAIQQALPAEVSIPDDASPEAAAESISNLQYEHGPADLASAAVAAGQPDRGLELAAAELKKRGTPKKMSFAQATGLRRPPAGQSYKVSTDEGIDVDYKGPDDPKLETVKDPKAPEIRDAYGVRRFYDDKGNLIRSETIPEAPRPDPADKPDASGVYTRKTALKSLGLPTDLSPDDPKFTPAVAAAVLDIQKAIDGAEVRRVIKRYRRGEYEEQGGGGGAYKTPDDVKAAVAGGKLSREDGLKILRGQFGFE